jgi:hypothetical protein
MTAPAHAPRAAAGANDHPHFAEGWHVRERDGRCGIPYRACGARAVLVLARQSGARRVQVLMSGPRGLAHADLTGALEVEDAKGSVASRTRLHLGADLWVVRSLELPAGEGPIRLVFHADAPVCPEEVLGNGDPRRLGWFVSAAWQSA